MTIFRKLGDREYEKFGKEKMEEARKEEIIENKIKVVRKERHKEHRPAAKEPSKKRRKLDKDRYENNPNPWGKPA